MSIKNFIPDDGSLWSIRAVDISGNYGQKLLFDTSGNAIIKTGNTDRLTIGNTGAWNVQGGMSYNNATNTLTATTFIGALSGNATSATNIAGGLGGQIPYQSAASTTALLSNGTAGQVLTSAGTTLAPTWTTPVSIDPTITETNTNAVFYPTFVSGTGAAQTLRADSTIGPFSINPSTGDFNIADTFKITQNAVALGKSAGLTGQNSGAVALGLNAGNLNQGANSIAIGKDAGVTNQGSTGGNGIAIGQFAGQTNQPSGCIAIGFNSGNIGQGASNVAVGLRSGQTNQGESSVAVGVIAAQTTQGSGCVALGYGAANNTQGNSSVAIGYNSAQTTQSTNAVSIGYQAGQITQGNGSVAIGRDAGQQNQSQLAVAVGYDSGQISQGANCIAVGYLAGENTQTANAVAIGTLAAQITQGGNAVAIGYNAANSTQGDSAVAIGRDSGAAAQGSNSIAVGRNAGGLTQGASSVAVGFGAGRYTQGSSAVAVGTNAGGGILSTTFQGNGAVAIGTNAGQGTTSGQGANSIAIGLNTGVASQTAGSICLNASGLALNPSTASFYVNPIATTQQPAVTVVQERQGLVYNTTTNELTAGAFNTYSVCYNNITGIVPPLYSGVGDKSFALTPVGTGITATVWQCTFVGERGGGILPYLSTGIATFVGGVNRWTWSGYNGGGDFGTPTKFYGLVGSQLLYFSCGDFTSFDNVRFTFTRLY